MVNVGLLFSFFYNVVVSWSLWYFLASFSLELPWSTCDHEYNSPNCREEDEQAGHGHGHGNESAATEYWSNYVLEEKGRSWTDYVRI